MQLELASFKINRVELGPEMALHGQTLIVNAEIIRNAFFRENAFEDVTIDVAHPGESIRIVHVLDAIEPRVKTVGPGVAFPGFLGPAKTVGEGKTSRLEGLSIVQTAEFPEPTSGVLSVREAFIDMTGPAAPYCACSNTANLVLSFRPKAGITNEKFDAAIRHGSLRLAEKLAAVRIIPLAGCKVAAEVLLLGLGKGGNPFLLLGSLARTHGPSKDQAAFGKKGHGRIEALYKQAGQIEQYPGGLEDRR